MISFETGLHLPHWTPVQWLGVFGVLLLVAFAGIVIYIVFFAMPGGIKFVPAGEDYQIFWRDIMDQRAEIRGRLTKRMVILLGFALGLLGGAGALIKWLF